MLNLKTHVKKYADEDRKLQQEKVEAKKSLRRNQRLELRSILARYQEQYAADREQRVALRNGKGFGEGEGEGLSCLVFCRVVSCLLCRRVFHLVVFVVVVSRT